MSLPASPSPRDPTRLQRAIIWTALFAAPLIWLLHLLVSIKLVSTACSGGITQHNALPWDELERFVTIASVLAFGACLALVVAAGRALRQIVSLAPRRGDAIRFVAWCSVASAAAFTFGLAFSGTVLLVLPLDRLCAPFR
ncbi:hypothetical protein WJ542_29745 [Paraburkholderia sp. B3]|uniref:hypothetical protein n=1 Tax=Paraburkholderia sp. B3 TaxID=3134791 RepID=UPI003982C541